MNTNTARRLSEAPAKLLFPRKHYWPITGRVEQRRHLQDRQLRYWLYVPSTGGEGAPVVVTVHGISRNAAEHAREFAPLAERYGAVIVAPKYDRKRFPYYQKLRSNSALMTPRADQALDQILTEVGELTGARIGKIYLFGYSGGGQFAHRFAMAYPSRIKTVALGAPGWYTFPTAKRRFPHGLRSNVAALQLKPTDFLRIPMVVFVGEQDHQRDQALNCASRIDQQQGLNRVERGRRWIRAMQLAALQCGYATRYEFHLLRACGHSFTECMETGHLGQRAFEFLFSQFA